MAIGEVGQGGERKDVDDPVCPDSHDVKRVAAVCTWLPDGGVNSALCDGFTQGDAEGIAGVEAGSIGAASAALTHLASVHTTCDQTFGLANSADEGFAAPCSVEVPESVSFTVGIGETAPEFWVQTKTATSSTLHRY